MRCVSIYFFLLFLGNLARCSAFTKLRGDEWRNCKAKVVSDLESSIAIKLILYNVVVDVMLIIISDR